MIRIIQTVIILMLTVEIGRCFGGAIAGSLFKAVLFIINVFVIIKIKMVVMIGTQHVFLCRPV
ncbi:Uncharacterised protein [Mycobacteroides abscessus subsp. abscessus]|nr:Uncharacterised protein [Mycobacteroides abscessus subsp. abscessus]